jgi:hypothetical protein
VIEVLECESGQSIICNDILRSLPEWFGIEEAIQNYVREVASLQTFVAKDTGVAVGFISLKAHTQFAAERSAKPGEGSAEKFSNDENLG